MNEQADSVTCTGFDEHRLPLWTDRGKKKVARIKTVCGFNPSFDLLGGLRAVQTQLGEWHAYEPVSAKNKRAFARAIAKHSGELLKLLQNARDDEFAHLVGDDAARPYKEAHGINWGGISVSLGQLSAHLPVLKQRAIDANKRKLPRGRRQGDRLDNLFLELCKLYVDAFREKARRVTTGVEFSGKFVHFCLLVLPLFRKAIRLSNSALGAIVLKAIAALDEEMGIKRRPNK